MTDNSEINIIPEKYDILKKDYINLQKELDDTKQELYGSKRNVQILEAVQNDYQLEIELLQSRIEREKKVSEEKIQNLEEQNVNLKKKFNNEIHELEETLLKSGENNLALKHEIELSKRTNFSVDNDYINKLNEEIACLKDDNIKLSEFCEEVKVSLEDQQRQNEISTKTIIDMKSEIVELKTNLHSKKEELKNANELVEKLNDELVFMKNELDLIKNQPLEKSARGNSLFAEVDDRRVYLQTTINQMKSDFMNMKQERGKHLREIHHLKLENGKLLTKWKADVSEIDEDHYTEIRSLKDRIEILEGLLENYKKDLNTKQTTDTKDTFEGFEFYSLMIKNKNQQIEDLREQLSSRTLTEILLSKALSEANDEKRKWKLEAALKTNELELLSGESEIEKKPKEVDTARVQRSPRKVAKTEDEEDGKTAILDDRLRTLTVKSNVTTRKHFRSLQPTDTYGSGSSASETRLVEKNLKHSNTIDLQDISFSQQTSPISNKNVELTEEISNSEASNDVNIDSTKDGVIAFKTEIEIVPIESSNDNTQSNSFEMKKIEKNEDKENISKSDISLMKSDSSKKVTFSKNTVSPKESGLRKCKKVIVCKPIVFDHM